MNEFSKHNQTAKQCDFRFERSDFIIEFVGVVLFNVFGPYRRWTTNKLKTNLFGGIWGVCLVGFGRYLGVFGGGFGMVSGGLKYPPRPSNNTPQIVSTSWVFSFFCPETV